jgi:hypothetical protein
LDARNSCPPVEQSIANSPEALAIEWDVEFCGKLDGIEGTARKKPFANLNGGNSAASIVDTQNEILGVWIVFNIDFAELQASSGHKGFGAAAIRTPRSGIHDDRFGW